MILIQTLIMLLYPTLGDKSIQNDTEWYIKLKRSSIMKPLKTKVSITLDTDLIQSIKLLAEEDDRSFSQYINLVLKEYLKDKKLIQNWVEKENA